MILDLDGVICTTSVYGLGTKNKWESYMFDIKCVAILNFIIQETGCEIILSSDWRNKYTLQEIREIFAHNFVIKGPIGFTPSLGTYTGTNLESGRSDEIESWIKTHAWKDDVKWVAVDDLNMDERLFPNFVWCKNEHEGIKRKGVKEAIIEKLNS